MTAKEQSAILAERYGLSITARPARKGAIDDMPAGSNHYTVTMRGNGKTFSFPFSQGPACKESPTLYDVLTCLVSDANMLDCGDLDSFDQYAETFGLDSDSRSDERKYKKIVVGVTKNTEGLKAVIADDKAFALLLQDEDAQ